MGGCRERMGNQGRTLRLPGKSNKKAAAESGGMGEGDLKRLEKYGTTRKGKKIKELVTLNSMEKERSKKVAGKKGHGEKGRETKSGGREQRIYNNNR